MSIPEPPQRDLMRTAKDLGVTAALLFGGLLVIAVVFAGIQYLGHHRLPGERQDISRGWR